MNEHFVSKAQLSVFAESDQKIETVVDAICGDDDEGGAVIILETRATTTTLFFEDYAAILRWANEIISLTASKVTAKLEAEKGEDTPIEAAADYIGAMPQTAAEARGEPTLSQIEASGEPPY